MFKFYISKLWQINRSQLTDHLKVQINLMNQVEVVNHKPITLQSKKSQLNRKQFAVPMRVFNLRSLNQSHPKIWIQTRKPVTGQMKKEN